MDGFWNCKKQKSKSIYSGSNQREKAPPNATQSSSWSRKRRQASLKMLKSRSSNAWITAAFNSSTVACGVTLDTLSTLPHKKLSKGFRSGELGGHCSGRMNSRQFSRPSAYCGNFCRSTDGSSGRCRPSPMFNKV